MFSFQREVDLESRLKIIRFRWKIEYVSIILLVVMLTTIFTFIDVVACNECETLLILNGLLAFMIVFFIFLCVSILRYWNKEFL